VVRKEDGDVRWEVNRLHPSLAERIKLDYKFPWRFLCNVKRIKS
jgi:hypothetical protein